MRPTCEARRCAARLALALLCAAPCAAADLHPAAAQSLRGEVSRAGRGVAGAAVQLHRVTRAERGVVDSTTSGPEGEFSLTLPPVDSVAGFTVFFATATTDGVRYFGPAIHPDQSAERYRVTVY
ncbi:MAG TPA: hypothetical protein VEW03_12975, partial [Longimicrobiaceae bacterium]|nr:hypothetical protein [Longimicrobiaceae bacterium]